MNPVEVSISLESNDNEVNIGVESNDLEVSLGLNEAIGGGGTNDYRKLKNKPSINGTDLYDNYNEIDPTVHGWAKEPHKPSYTAEEVGAVDEDNEMSFTAVKAIWDSIFNN